MREFRSTVYENNDKVSHAVSEFIRETALLNCPLALRPFNRFDTANTDWWLIPSSEYPAYKFAKLCFHRYPRNTDSMLYTGFYVEKGLSPQLSNLPDVQKKYIMGNDWFWHSFLKQTSEGVVSQIIEQVCRNTEAEIRILIEANEFNKVPEPDMERHAPSDTAEFSVFPTNQQWKVIQEGQGVLSKLSHATSMSELSQQFSAINDLRFYWVDLVMGVRLKYADKHGWFASSIWENALKPWVILFK